MAAGAVLRATSLPLRNFPELCSWAGYGGAAPGGCEFKVYIEFQDRQTGLHSETLLPASPCKCKLSNRFQYAAAWGVGVGVR